MAWFCTSEEPKEGDGGPRAAEGADPGGSRAADPGGQSTRRGIVIVVAADADVESITNSKFKINHKTA